MDVLRGAPSNNASGSGSGSSSKNRKQTVSKSRSPTDKRIDTGNIDSLSMLADSEIVYNSARSDNDVDVTNIGEVEEGDDAVSHASDFSTDSIETKERISSTSSKRSVRDKEINVRSKTPSPIGRGRVRHRTDDMLRETTPSPEQKPTPARSANSAPRPHGSSFSPPKKSVGALLLDVSEGGEASSLLALAAEPAIEISFSPSMYHSKEVIAESDSTVKDDIEVCSNEDSSPSSGAEELKRANDCIMEALYTERNEKARLQIKLATSKDDLRELETKKDVELDEYRVEIIRLKAKLRQMSAEKSLSDIYETFEEDLKR